MAVAVPPPPPPPPSQERPATQKVADVIGTLRPCKQFKFQKADVSATSLSFDDTGEYLLAACNDDTLEMYNAKEGKTEKTLLSKKYGCHLARFTHHSQSIIYASTKVDDGIRYLSTHDNQFLRYFRGHTAAVTSLALCPANDTFLSCSLDNTVRLWDLSSPNAQGKLNLSTPTLSAYDPSGTVVAIASPSAGCILLYDLRNFDKPPFATFDVLALSNTAHLMSQGGMNALPRDWTRIEFSNDGKSLLLATNSSVGHIILDAFSGIIKAFLVRSPQYLPLKPNVQRAAPLPGSANSAQLAGQGDACFSADGRYVVGASGGDKEASIWDLQQDVASPALTLRPIGSLPCTGKVAVVEWNPRYNMLATGDREVVMWLPDEHVSMKQP